VDGGVKSVENRRFEIAHNLEHQESWREEVRKSSVGSLKKMEFQTGGFPLLSFRR
jgi:hypothetical protein